MQIYVMARGLGGVSLTVARVTNPADGAEQSAASTARYDCLAEHLATSRRRENHGIFLSTI